jgi:LmbE family N-acetylglucosaminyl deacetylase
MLNLQLAKPAGASYRILCLGAHCDDIEIGCGGTLLRCLEQSPNSAVHWIVFCSTTARAEEARRSALTFLQRAGQKEITIKQFDDGFLPYSGREVKTFFEELKSRISPDLIFTHYRHDLHQDHRLICDLTWNTWRDHVILEYEVPKYDGDFGNPNLFVELEESLCRRKTQYIFQHFPTQQQKHWFAEETLLALLRLRGMQCRATSKHAEAFYSRKTVLTI